MAGAPELPDGYFYRVCKATIHFKYFSVVQWVVQVRKNLFLGFSKRVSEERMGQTLPEMSVIAQKATNAYNYWNHHNRERQRERQTKGDYR